MAYLNGKKILTNVQVLGTGGASVEANPSTPASSELKKLKVSNITYSVVSSDELATKQDALTFDNTPTANSNNPVKSGGVKAALDAKQDALISGTTIKTVNGADLLGNGNIQISADATITLDPITNAEIDAAFSQEALL